jgi:hypothetical protein
VFGVKVVRGLGRHDLEVGRQLKTQLLKPLRIVRPLPHGLALGPCLQRSFDQPVKLQPPGGQGQAQQQRTGFTDQIDRIAVKVAATALQGEEQAQGCNVGIGDQAAMRATADQVVGLRAIGRWFAVAAPLQRPAARNAQVGRIARMQHIDHAYRGLPVGHRRSDACAQFAQPLAGGRARHSEIGIGWRHDAIRTLWNAAQLVERKQNRNHMFAVLLDWTHANALDIADLALTIPVQPEGYAIRFRQGPLHQRFDVNLAGLLTHRLDGHPRFGRIVAARAAGSPH